MKVLQFLQVMVERGASDLFFSTGAPVNVKIEGITHPLTMPALPPGEVKHMAYQLMNPTQVAQFEVDQEMNLAISFDELGRFRINVFMQRGETGMVIRYIKSNIPAIATLDLPATLERLVMLNRGLVLVVGAAGSGKSTTLASMLDYRNQNATGHILTIEDPLEFIHAHKRSVVDQREVGIDTKSYADALKNALREAPDVIMIGEIRDRATMQQAIAYSETGHLCLSTLHASNANQAMERIINFFPDDAHHQLLTDLSLHLEGVIAQRLIPGQKQKLVLACELLLSSSFISELIAKGDIGGIKEAMAGSNEMGMFTFDQSLYNLYMDGKISLDEAMLNADSRTDLSLRVRLSTTVKHEAPPDMALEPPPPGGIPVWAHK